MRSNKSKIAKYLLLACTLVLCINAQNVLAQQGSARHKRSVRQASPASWQPKRSTRNSSRRTVARTNSARPGVVPALASETVVQIEDVVDQGEMLTPNANYHMHQSTPAGCDSCGMTGICACNPVGYLFDWRRADLWAGVTSFSGEGNFLTTGSSTDGEVEGSFGFQQGFNFGSRMPSLLAGQVGAQFGMRFTQSQIYGTGAGDDGRTQTFVTTGLFRRVDYGLQGGLVVDYLHDDWIYKADLLQLRGELSFLFSPCHDLGFRFTNSQQVDNTEAFLRNRAGSLPLELSSLDTYRFFYRVRYGPAVSGAAEINLGFSEDSHTILGLDLKTALQGQVGLQVSSTYSLPHDQSNPKYAREGWNLGLAMVWTPGRCFGQARDYYRPLFDVADNGSLLVKRHP